MFHTYLPIFLRTLTTRTLAILLNKDTFEPDPFVISLKVESTSKNTWGMVLLIVRAMLRRPSLSGSPTVHILLCTYPQCCGQET